MPMSSFLRAAHVACAAFAGLTAVTAIVGCGVGVTSDVEVLLEAIDLDDQAAIVRALENGTDPNGADWDGDPVLIYALYDGDAFAVRKLLEAGADPHARYDDESALRMAASMGDEFALPLIEHGARLTSGEDTRALSDAASEGHIGTLGRLLEMGADPKPRNEEDWDPLWAACSAGNLEAYELLVAAGASAEPSELISYAFDSGKAEFAEAMLARFPEAQMPPGWFGLAVTMDSQGPRREWVERLLATRPTPEKEELDRSLGHAAQILDPDLIAYLLELGADVRKGNLLADAIEGSQSGAEPHGDATFAATRATVEALIAAGADPNHADSSGEDRNALVLAVSGGNLRVIELLLEKGADPDRANQESGRTPLMSLLEARWDPMEALLEGEDEDGEPSSRTKAEQRLDAAELLLAAGADVGIADGAGHTALHLAAYRGNPAMVERFLAAGADPKRRDSQGRSPADLARAGRPESLEPDAPARLLLKVSGLGEIIEARQAGFDQVLEALGEPSSQPVAEAAQG